MAQCVVAQTGTLMLSSTGEKLLFKNSGDAIPLSPNDFLVNFSGMMRQFNEPNPARSFLRKKSPKWQNDKKK